MDNIFADTFTFQNKIISYTDIGTGNPLVLIHAFPTDQRLWQAQQAELKKFFRVITLDLWGFGKSSPADGKAISMTDYAEEVNGVLEYLKINKAIIGGESMGGYVALAFLQQYPDKVFGLILSDTQSLADNDEAKIKRETTAVDVLMHGTTSFIDGFIPKALSENANTETKLFLRKLLETQDANAVASALRGMALRFDTSNLLATSTLPILIITGEKDILISPQQSKNMHNLAKNSQLVEIANSGHLANLEQPKQWNQAVLDMFLNKHKE